MYFRGMAQLIDSPTTFHIQPMQIDTKNRHYNGSDFKPDLLPKASAAPPNAPYSGLLECPCTDRIVKKVEVEYATQSQGSCATTVGNATECFLAASKVIDQRFQILIIHLLGGERQGGCQQHSHLDFSPLRLLVGQI